MRQDFVCEQCGLCCKSVSKDYWKNGEMTEGDVYGQTGGCDKLNADNTCGIYNEEDKPFNCKNYPDKSRCDRELKLGL